MTYFYAEIGLINFREYYNPEFLLILFLKPSQALQNN